MTGAPRGPPGPPPSRARRSPERQVRGGGRGGADRAEERPERGARSRPPRLPGCGGPAVSGRGLGCLGVPARLHQHLSVVFLHRRRLLIRARQLQQRLQRRCAKPGRRGASRRGCGGRVDSGEEAAASREGALRCSAAGGGPLAAVESSEGAGRGGVNCDSVSPFPRSPASFSLRPPPP